SVTPRQLVAHAGLDPRPIESGSSVHKPRRISKRGNSRLRHILYMTALVAAHHDRHFGAYYAKLLLKQKAKKSALVAVMRKQLHVIGGILLSGSAFDGSRLFPRLVPEQPDVAVVVVAGEAVGNASARFPRTARADFGSAGRQLPQRSWAPRADAFLNLKRES